MTLWDWIIVACVAPFAWHFAHRLIANTEDAVSTFLWKLTHKGKKMPFEIPRPTVGVDCHICQALRGDICMHLSDDVEDAS